MVGNDEQNKSETDDSESIEGEIRDTRSKTGVKRRKAEVKCIKTSTRLSSKQELNADVEESKEIMQEDKNEVPVRSSEEEDNSRESNQNLKSELDSSVAVGTESEKPANKSSEENLNDLSTTLPSEPMEAETSEGIYDKVEADTENVVERKTPLDTEEVSDEELPEPSGVSTDLPETEAVSEDELPPEKGSDKRRKRKVAPSPVKSDTKSVEPEFQDGIKKLKTEDKKDTEKVKETKSTSVASDSHAFVVESQIRFVPPICITSKPSAKTKKSLPELEKYWKAVKEDSSDFNGWTYLLQYVDQENDLEAAREAYDAFLSHYPYCYGYWRKYADYERRKNNKEKCEEVFERGLKAIPLSVDLWIHYLNYCKSAMADNEEKLRSQYEKAIRTCGLEFRSDRLWDSYIKWESEGKRLQNVTTIYDRLLAVPTQNYSTHFDNFQDHAKQNPPQKTLSVDEFLNLRREIVRELKKSESDDPEPGDDVEAPPGEEPEEETKLKNDEESVALREKIISIRRKIHKITASAVTERWNFEEGIKRPYFHVKPLERSQLKNWKEYLEFEIEKKDHARIVIIFERCLIACALYEEFWVKYVRYLETIDGDHSEQIRDIFNRACCIHHTKKPNLHLLWAIFEENNKNYERASEILSNLEKNVPNLLQTAYRRINLERRRNDYDKVCTLYEHYIGATKNKLVANNMNIKYARFCWKVKQDFTKALSILHKAIEKDKENPRLYLQLIDFHLQKSSVDEEAIITVIDDFLSRDSDPDHKVMFSQRKIEFLEDFGSDIASVQKAYEDLQKFIKIAKDRKKKVGTETDVNKIEGTLPKKIKSSSETNQTPSHGTAYAAGPHTTTNTASGNQSTGNNYSQSYSQNSNYSQQGTYQSGQYSSQPQTSYNQQYNQQYNQSDPNYANYQNWGYSQTGYSGYNQGWGNYNYY